MLYTMERKCLLELLIKIMYIYIKKNIPQNHVELPEPLTPELYDDLGKT